MAARTHFSLALALIAVLATTLASGCGRSSTAAPSAAEPVSASDRAALIAEVGGTAALPGTGAPRGFDRLTRSPDAFEWRYGLEQPASSEMRRRLYIKGPFDDSGQDSYFHTMVFADGHLAGGRHFDAYGLGFYEAVRSLAPNDFPF